MDNKLLMKNAVYNVLYKLLNALFPLISAVYIAHVILASGTGKVASVQNIVQYFVVIAALGIPVYGTREIAKVRDKHQQKNKVFSELFIINMISTICCAVVYYCVIYHFTFFSAERSLYLVAGGSIVLNIINIDWFYQGMEEYGYITLRSFLVKAVSLLALVLLVRKKEDYVVYAVINVMALAGNHVFNIYNLRHKNIRFSVNNLNIFYHAKSVLVLLGTSVAIELYTLLDITMLTIFCQEDNVGYYTGSIKIVKIIVMVIAAIGGVVLPGLSRCYSEGKAEVCNKIVNRVLEAMIFFILPCGLGLILTAEDAIPILFGSSFLQAVPTLKIAALLVYTLGLSNLFGTQILLAFGGEKKLLLCTIIGAISNIIINGVLIPLYAQDGAAVASVTSEGLVTIMTFIFSTKYIKYRLNVKFIFVSLVSCLMMILSLWCIKKLFPTGVIRLITEIAVAAIIYLFVNLILKNPLLNELRTLMASMIFRRNKP